MNSEIIIVKANNTDIKQISKIYENARNFMKKTGNPLQWTDGYPSDEQIRKDVKDEVLYLIKENGTIIGVFVFIIGEESSYKRIQGKWLNNEKYGTIHRVASAGLKRGVFGICSDYCKKIIDNVKIDTHKDNLVMKKQIEKNNYEYCGIVTLSDNTVRDAYQWIK